MIILEELKNDYKTLKKMKKEISESIKIYEDTYSKTDDLGIDILKSIEDQQILILEAIARMFYKRLFYSFGLDLLIYEAYEIQRKRGFTISLRGLDISTKRLEFSRKK